jgi:hypothetical protein
MFEVIEHTIADNITLVPFLFLTYLAMEFLEHKTGERTTAMIQKAGHFGPFIGGIAGIIPQCGLSAAASSLYAGRVISMGTLLSIYLSTSDEMLPILISERVGVPFVITVLLIKAGIGILAGFFIDFLFHHRVSAHEPHIHELCAKDHCHCEQGIFRSACKHTIKITLFILLITFAMNLFLHYVGEDALANLILNRPILGPALSGLIGLIPNCAASVVITQLYLQGALDFGSMMAGLLVGAGVGIMVLLRVNKNTGENIKIITLLYAIGVICGILIQLIWSFQGISTNY